MVDEMLSLVHRTRMRIHAHVTSANSRSRSRGVIYARMYYGYSSTRGLTYSIQLQLPPSVIQISMIVESQVLEY